MTKEDEVKEALGIEEWLFFDIVNLHHKINRFTGSMFYFNSKKNAWWEIPRVFLEEAQRGAEEMYSEDL